MDLDDYLVLVKQCLTYITRDEYQQLVTGFPFSYHARSTPIPDLIEWCDTNIGEYQIWRSSFRFDRTKYIREHKFFRGQGSQLDKIIVHIKNEQDYSFFLLRWS